MRSRWCGHLAHPQDDSGYGHDSAVVSGGLLISGCDTSELLELAEAAFDKVALGIEVLVERMLAGAGWIVGDDGDGSLVSDHLPEMVRVIGCVSHNDFGGEVLDQGGGLRHIAHLTRCERKAHRASQPSNRHMDLGA